MLLWIHLHDLYSIQSKLEVYLHKLQWWERTVWSVALYCFVIQYIAEIRLKSKHLNWLSSWYQRIILIIIVAISIASILLYQYFHFISAIEISLIRNIFKISQKYFWNQLEIATINSKHQIKLILEYCDDRKFSLSIWIYFYIWINLIIMICYVMLVTVKK